LFWDDAQQTKVLARFGWKANESSVLQQTANALCQEMGNTYSYFLIENGASQFQAIKAHNQEISDVSLNNMTLYLQVLATTARRNFGNTQVQAGYTLFI